jgi:hypothetical protein
VGLRKIDREDAGLRIIRPQKQTPSTADEHDEGPSLAREEDPYIPELDGKNRQAICLGHDWNQSPRYGKNKITLYVHFEIIEGQYQGTRVWEAFEFEWDEEKQRPKPKSPRSKYADEYRIANGGPALRRERMSPQRFKGSVFVVELATVTHGRCGKKHHKLNRYTKVRRIVDIVTEPKPMP